MTEKNVNALYEQIKEVDFFSNSLSIVRLYMADADRDYMIYIKGPASHFASALTTVTEIAFADDAISYNRFCIVTITGELLEDSYIIKIN